MYAYESTHQIPVALLWLRRKLSHVLHRHERTLLKIDHGSRRRAAWRDIFDGKFCSGLVCSSWGTAVRERRVRGNIIVVA